MSPFRLGAPTRRAGRLGLPLLSAAAVLLAASPASAAPDIVRRFATPGCLDTQFTVPAGVTSIDVRAQGGAGAVAYRVAEAAGRGALLTATLDVSPGDRPYICVDFGGRYGGSSSFSSGKGGGLAAVSTGGSLASAEVVAGGGGGTGGGTVGTAGGDAGLPGGSADAGSSGLNARGGGGGTQSGVGSGGANAIVGVTADGMPGSGNNGGSSSNGPSGAGGGGGGGGGWFGGGGGATGEGSVNIDGGGGGGGSSFCDPSLTCGSSLVSSTSYVEISYADPTRTTTAILMANPGAAAAGATVTYTTAIVPVPDGGTVTVSEGGTPVSASCTNAPVDTATGTVSCTASAPSGSGDHTIDLAYSGNGLFTTATGSTTLHVLLPTTTVVTVDPATPVAGETARYVATVSPDPISGDVAFEVGGEAPYGCDTVPVVDGIATCETQIPWEADEQTLTASYLGNADYATSTDELRFDPLAALVTITPDPVAYGDVVLGESATRTVTVTNSGDADLEIDRIIISDRAVDLRGPDASGHLGTRDIVRSLDFDAVTDDCTDARVAPGDSCTVTVAFSPFALGGRSGLLRVTGLYAGHLDPVQLTGAGVSAPSVPDDPTPPANDPTPPKSDPAPPAAQPTPAVTTPAPPVSPAGPAATIRGAVLAPSANDRAAVSERGTIALPLACPNGQACRVDGTLTLTVASGSKARAAAAATKVLLRFSGIRVAANRTRTLSLRLPAAFVKAQQAKGVRKLRTTLTIKTTLANGASATTRQQVTLLIPRARAAQKATPKPKPAQRPSFTG